jgi:hypothetical protein
MEDETIIRATPKTLPHYARFEGFMLVNIKITVSFCTVKMDTAGTGLVECKTPSLWDEIMMKHDAVTVTRKDSCIEWDSSP